MQNYTAIITGAGQGLGRATALEFVKNGINVLITDLNEDALIETQNAATDITKIHYLVQDITTEDAPHEAVKAAIDKFGGLDFVINNAGIGKSKSLVETSDLDWDRYTDLNLRSVFRLSKAAIPHLKASRGVIINLGSIFGLLGFPGTAPYAATKSAVMGLTKQMATDLGPKGIRVNAIAPGIIKTPLTADRIDNDKQFQKLMVETTPFQRVGTPEDVANAIYFLCSDKASFINGHTLVVDGGWSTSNYISSAFNEI